MSEEAAIYCRLSLARFGDTTKVDDQERICRGVAAARDWHVPDHLVFVDNNRSAWQRDRKRPDWDRMVGLVKAGRLRRLVNYHGDRLIRQPFDLETLITFADSFGVIIASPTGEYQLDQPNDRFVLRVLTAKACLESDDTSRRKKAGFARMALAGQAPTPGGRFGRGFGYERDGCTPVPAEAAALEEAAGRVLAGEHLYTIAADLTRRGIMSVSGQPLTYQSLRRILTRPRVAGLLADGRPGTWPPLVERQKWEAARAVLSGRATAYTGRVSVATHLLSGIAVCGAPAGKAVCGAGLQVQYSAGVAGYACRRPGCGKVRRAMSMLDAYVSAAVVGRLAVSPPGAVPPDLVAASRLATVEGELAEVEAAIADPHSGKRLGALLARAEALEQDLAQLREASAGDARARLRAAHTGITAGQFAALPIAVRRSLVSACVSVTVLPASKRGPGFRTEDVVLAPAGP